MSIETALETCIAVTRHLDQLGIDYLVGGSVAGSFHGIPRSTQDVDLVADLKIVHIRPLVQALEASFYIDADRIRQAIQRRSSFNIIFLKTMFKVDIFVLKQEPLAREEMRRRQRIVLDEETGAEIEIASPEDTILQKLAWYEKANRTSDRQWNDLLGILKVSRDLDRAYLWKWATHLDVHNLFHRLLEEAGLDPEEPPL